MEALVTVPGSEATLVEYPAFVRDTQAAIDSLGGIQAVSAAAETEAQKEAELALNVRPSDPLAHPIVGDRQQIKGLILRIRASKGSTDAGASGDKQVEVTAVARVSSTFQFNSLADFQYTSLPSSVVAGQHAQDTHPSGPIGWDREPLLCAPPVFSRIDSPLDYGFRSFYGGDPDAYKAGLGGMGAGGRMAAHVANFNAVEVPGQWNVHGDRADAGLSRERRELFRRVAQLLEQRPLWSAAELAEALWGAALTSAGDLDIVLPRLAFVFRNGPWQGLWVRRGYDPRLDDSSRRWQALHYTVPPSWYHHTVEGTVALSQAEVAPLVASSLSQIFRFEGIPSTAVTILQVGCLQDATIQATINARLSDHRQCDLKSGWFTAAAWDKIVRQVQKRFKLLVLGASAAAAQGAGTSGHGQPDAAASIAEAAMEVDT